MNASELADCIGCGKYASRFAKWEEKTGRRARQPVSREQLRAMEIGKHLEKFTLQDWCEENCATVLDYQLPGIACEVPEIRATIESIVELPTGEKVVVEVKTTSSNNGDLGEDGTDQIPPSWMVQVQAEIVAAERAMKTAFVERAIIVVLNRTTCEIREYSVPFNGEMWARIRERAAEFWKHVRLDITPPASWCEIDERLNRHLWLEDLGEPIDFRLYADGKVAESDWLRYEAIGRDIKRLEEEREELKASVIVAMGDHRRAILGDGRELVIQQVERKGYVVHPKTYCQLKARKLK